MKGLEYNTDRPIMRISEYGRGVQKMINHIKTIEDKEERNRAAKSVIVTMASLTPGYRDYDDFRQKLWDHLFVMADFDLDIDSPYPKPTRESVAVRPRKPNYPSKVIKYRHYGKVMENMIGEIAKWEDTEVKEMVVESIANQLKKSYMAWNRDSVHDDVILDHLSTISGGKLKLSENARISQNLPMKSDNFDRNRNFGKHNNSNKNFKKKNKNFKKRY